jgi:hypothetical protein
VLEVNLRGEAVDDSAPRHEPHAEDDLRLRRRADDDAEAALELQRARGELLVGVSECAGASVLCAYY